MKNATPICGHAPRVVRAQLVATQILRRPAAPEGYTLGYWDNGIKRYLNSITVIPVLLNIGTPEAQVAAGRLGDINRHGISYANQDQDLLGRALGIIRTAELAASLVGAEMPERWDGLA